MKGLEGLCPVVFSQRFPFGVLAMLAQEFGRIFAPTSPWLGGFQLFTLNQTRNVDYCAPVELSMESIPQLAVRTG
jgi:hypothetical protein